MTGWDQGAYDKEFGDGGGEDPTPFEIEYQLYAKLQIDTSRVSLIGGFLITGSVAAIYGPFGSGKTALAVHCALCVAQGKEFFGRKTKQCGVLIFAMEASATTIKRILAVRGVPKDVPLAVVTLPFDITNAAGAGSIVNLVKKIETECGFKIGLVIVDTLSRAVGPEFQENDNSDMNDLANMCAQIARDTMAAVLLIHHEGKNDKLGMRGGIALANALDTVLHCFPAKDKVFSATDKHERGGKQRDLEAKTELRWTHEQVEFDQRDDDGNIITSIRVVEVFGPESGADKRDRNGTLSGRKAIALDALKKAITNDGNVLAASRIVPAGQNGVSRSIWRAYFDQLLPPVPGQKRDTQKHAFNRTLESLQSLNIIGVSGDDVWVIA
jgi:hypothetical protein